MKRAIVILVVLVLVFGVIAIAGCGGSSSSSSSQTPQQVIQAYYDALGKQDATTTWNLMSAESQKGMGSKSEWETALKSVIGPGQHMVKVTAGKTTINGNKATVEITGNVNGTANINSVPLVKENGVWKVDVAGTATQ